LKFESKVTEVKDGELTLFNFDSKQIARTTKVIGSGNFCFILMCVGMLYKGIVKRLLWRKARQSEVFEQLQVQRRLNILYTEKLGYTLY